MDVSQLKTLIHVAELGSLSKAADRLNIAQPALSRQIRLLESELGVYLFERHGRGMTITNTGRDVLDHATRVMTELEAIRKTAAGEGSSYKGMVAIGTTPTVAEIVTVPLVRTLREAHPQLSVRLTSAFTGHLIDWLQRGEIDMAAIYETKPLDSLRVVKVMVESLFLVSAPDKRLSLDKPIRFAELASHELILPSPRHGLRPITEDCARRAGIQLTASVEANSFGAMINLVRNGFGSTFLPLASFHPLVERGELCAAPLVDPTPTRTIVLAYAADRSISPAARFAGESFIAVARELVRQNVWIGHMIDGA